MNLQKIPSGSGSPRLCLPYLPTYKYPGKKAPTKREDYGVKARRQYLYDALQRWVYVACAPAQPDSFGGTLFDEWDEGAEQAFHATNEERRRLKWLYDEKFGLEGVLTTYP